MTVSRINEFEAAPKREEELSAFLQQLLHFIRSSEGCEGAELLVECGERGRFVVIERWASKGDHAVSLSAYPKEEMQAAMPLLGAPPRGRFLESI
jgi:quinol monooxygenase YgiN